MLKDMNSETIFCEYYRQWVDVYKKGAIREATMSKYLMTQKWVEKLVPELKLCELSRSAYQQLLNDYAKEHERQTTLDFHHQLKGAILDVVDEGLLERDPTRKAIIKGKTPRTKKIKYLNQFELHTLIAHLDIKEEINWDWFILLVAKTGMISSIIIETYAKIIFLHTRVISLIDYFETWYQTTGNPILQNIEEHLNISDLDERVKGFTDLYCHYVDMAQKQGYLFECLVCGLLAYDVNDLCIFSNCAVLS